MQTPPIRATLAGPFTAQGMTSAETLEQRAYLNWCLHKYGITWMRWAALSVD